MENQLTTKKCPSCQSEVSMGTSKCPYCGKSFKSWFRQHLVLTVIIGFFVLSNITGALSSIFNSQKAPSPEKSTKKLTDQTNINTPSPASKNSNDAKIIKEGVLLDKYNYGIAKQTEDNRYAAVFSPTFLPRDDAILKTAMYELINETYGKHTIANLEPKLLERSGTNLLTLEAVDGKYLFLIFKEDTGEIYGITYWKE